MYEYTYMYKYVYIYIYVCVYCIRMTYAHTYDTRLGRHQKILAQCSIDVFLL
jgi:hypothetical protein